jgi:tetratricopeptide (TPR) repeat protein
MIADSHNRRRRKPEGRAHFEAEAAFANSIFRSTIGDTEGCIRALDRAVEISPDYAPAVLALDLAWSLIESGSLQEALTTFERAVAMDPANELARENLRFCNQQIAKRRRKKPAESRLPRAWLRPPRGPD